MAFHQLSGNWCPFILIWMKSLLFIIRVTSEGSKTTQEISKGNNLLELPDADFEASHPARAVFTHLNFREMVRTIAHADLVGLFISFTAILGLKLSHPTSLSPDTTSTDRRSCFAGTGSVMKNAMVRCATRTGQAVLRDYQHIVCMVNETIYDFLITLRLRCQRTSTDYIIKTNRSFIGWKTLDRFLVFNAQWSTKVIIIMAKVWKLIHCSSHMSVWSRFNSWQWARHA